MKKYRINNIVNICSPFIFILLAAMFVILPQIITHQTIFRTDTFFHFNRFYDTMMQFKNQNFSFFQTNYGFQQSGRIINALYGPLFAYFNGLILLISHNWFTYQIISDFLISLLGAGTMYYLLRYEKVNRILATIVAILYINVGMIPAWINVSSGNGWGQALMPLVVLCGVRMLQDKQKPINWVQLMVVMSLIAQIHIISTIMAVLLLIPFFIAALIIRKQRKELWLNLGKSILDSIILSSNVIGAFIIVVFNNKLASPDWFNLAFGGLRLGRFDWIYGSTMAYILPSFFIILMGQFFYVCFHIRENFINSFVTFWGFIILFISSIYFRWGFVQRIFPFLSRDFQFPFRLTVIAYPLLLLGLALTGQQFIISTVPKKIISYLFITLVMCLAVYSNWHTNHIFVQKYNIGASFQLAAQNHDLSALFREPYYDNHADYLPISVKQTKNSKLGEIYKKNVSKRAHSFTHLVLHNGKLKLSWIAKKEDTLTLPLVMYKQSNLQLKKKMQLTKINSIGLPIIKQKKGLNTAVLNFVIPVWFTIISYLCLIIWLILIFIILFRKLILFHKIRD